MLNTIRHEEIGGGYSMQRKITLNAADLRPIGGQFEVMALDSNDNELDAITAPDEAAALAAFDSLVNKYAGPLQKAMNAAHLVPGHKYTIVYLGEFGFPVSYKITFHSMSFTTYAQYGDVVNLAFTPYRKRTLYSRRFYESSLLIFDGWQQMDESATKEVLRDDGQIKVTRSKYSCFSANFIEDLEKSFQNPVMIYKNYKTGVNGKLYA
jgi:hypothetical protein